MHGLIAENPGGSYSPLNYGKQDDVPPADFAINNSNIITMRPIEQIDPDSQEPALLIAVLAPCVLSPLINKADGKRQAPRGNILGGPPAKEKETRGSITCHAVAGKTDPEVQRFFREVEKESIFGYVPMDLSDRGLKKDEVKTHDNT